MAMKKKEFSTSLLKALIFPLMVQLIGISTAAKVAKPSSAGQGKMGTWKTLLQSTGVVAMHMTLTHENTVLMFDQVSGRSGYLLRQHRRHGQACSALDVREPSCWAHSVEYNIGSNSVRPLELQTDPWSSSGSFLSNGTLLQTGGHGNGFRGIRYFKPCSDHHCSWEQSRASLLHNRWYASNQILSTKDRVIVVGGRDTFSYEFVPRVSARGRSSFALPFLHQTNIANEDGQNLYPFLHMSSDGRLFVFANRDSILLDYSRDKVIKTYPRIPGSGSRNYPSSGSSVMLPLDNKDKFQKVEVMICGGASSGAYGAAKQGRFLRGMSSCGRMVITGNVHRWVMEEMPGPRLLSDMLILPTGQILIINGAQNGCGGRNSAANPSLQPYLYQPRNRRGQRFSKLRSTRIARMDHSSALLLPDGRVLVAGGNPNHNYTFRNVPYPTELRLQAFTPYYMAHSYHPIRPYNVSINLRHGQESIAYGADFHVRFIVEKPLSKDVEFTAYAPPFVTHSVSMNQRMLKLRCSTLQKEKGGWVNATVQAPPSAYVAPSGYYMLTVVNKGIPSLSQWVRFG